MHRPHRRLTQAAAPDTTGLRDAHHITDAPVTPRPVSTPVAGVETSVRTSVRRTAPIPAIPPRGTRGEVVARPAVCSGSRPLSTGDLRQAAEMISFSSVRVGR
jgi:hypothetical protein